MWRCMCPLPFGNAFGNRLVITVAGNNGGLDSLLQDAGPVKKSPAGAGALNIGSTAGYLLGPTIKLIRSVSGFTVSGSGDLFQTA